MAELFTHVLVGYILATLLSWRYEWLTAPLVTVAMIGATLPDLSRIGLLIDPHLVEMVLGVPFSWTPLHRVGGTAVVIAIGTLLTPAHLRRAVFLLLALGAGSHYALDLVLYKPAGVSAPLFWPLTDQGIPLEGFYLSTDRWPALLTATVAALVWYVDRTRQERREDA